jgi:hypothetical protein
MIDLVTNCDVIRALVIEYSFPTNIYTLTKESKHLTPELLFRALKPLEKRGLQLYIDHIKPLYEKIISDEIDLYKGAWKVETLKDGKKIHFWPKNP